jgi:hypothetical protein
VKDNKKITNTQNARPLYGAPHHQQVKGKCKIWEHATPIFDGMY